MNKQIKVLSLIACLSVVSAFPVISNADVRVPAASGCGKFLQDHIQAQRGIAVEELSVCPDIAAALAQQRLDRTDMVFFRALPALKASQAGKAEQAAVTESLDLVITSTKNPQGVKVYVEGAVSK